MEPEVGYPGTVILEPVDSFPEVGAAFTDGSVSLRGGAAVFEADTETSLLSTVPEPRSSTQCELVALCLALSPSPPPSAGLDRLTDIAAIGPGLGLLLQCSDAPLLRPH